MSMYGDTQKNRLFEDIECERREYESFWQFVEDLTAILADYIEGRDYYEEAE